MRKPFSIPYFTEYEGVSLISGTVAALGVSVQNFTQLGGRSDFLSPFICSRVFGLMRFCVVSDFECASNFVHLSGKVQRRPWQWLDKRCEKKAWDIYIRKVQTHWDRKRWDRWRAKSRECLSFYLISRGCSQRIRPGRPNSQFRKLLWRFTAIAWKYAKTSPGTLVTKELAVASWQRTVSHFFFCLGIFYQKHHDSSSTHLTFLSFLECR
jgi:hypothetical protein